MLYEVITDPCRDLLHPGDLALDLALVLGAADQRRDRVALGLEGFGFAEGVAAAAVEVGEPGKVGLLAAGGEAADDLVEIVTEQFAVEHGKTLVLCELSVITSYSIHYTKLYEAMLS